MKIRPGSKPPYVGWRSAGKELEEPVKGNLIPRNLLGVDCVLMAHR